MNKERENYLRLSCMLDFLPTKEEKESDDRIKIWRDPKSGIIHCGKNFLLFCYLETVIKSCGGNCTEVKYMQDPEEVIDYCMILIEK